ncbi:vomeronasal type-1 receptor 4-like [Cynocephalus volans]|uniref:vomeronasal type-1 receptor 4-like n=1 Tax=Cynocephalus volans TaxID=110931 RepID=UPI002FC67F62
MVLKIIKGTIFLFLTGLGILGNILVFVNYMCIFFLGTEKKSLHLILIHLAFTNILILFSRGIPKTIAAFGLTNFLDDTGCKMVVYVERVARGLSICTCSLLTVVQAITISPRASVWGKLNPRFTRHIFPYFLFFWILNSLISMNLLYYIKNISSMNISQMGESDNYCYFLPQSQIIKWIFLILMVLRDALFQGLMGWTSGYMVFLLHKHHEHVLYLQNSKFLYKTPPEIKAAQSVLLLMLCFFPFYWTDCIISFYLSSSLGNNSITVNVQGFLTLGYSILSPFVLIHRDGQKAKC